MTNDQIDAILFFLSIAMMAWAVAMLYRVNTRKAPTASQAAKILSDAALQKRRKSVRETADQLRRELGR